PPTRRHDTFAIRAIDNAKRQGRDRHRVEEFFSRVPTPELQRAGFPRQRACTREELRTASIGHRRSIWQWAMYRLPCEGVSGTDCQSMLSTGRQRCVKHKAVYHQAWSSGPAGGDMVDASAAKGTRCSFSCSGRNHVLSVGAHCRTACITVKAQAII